MSRPSAPKSNHYGLAQAEVAAEARRAHNPSIRRDDFSMGSLYLSVDGWAKKHVDEVAESVRIGIYQIYQFINLVE